MKPNVISAWLVLVMLVACAPSATPTPIPPTPDVRATETRIAFNIFATQTASVPTATRTSTATPTSTVTHTPAPTLTPTITNTPRPTSTPAPTNTPRPTDTATPSPTPVLQDQTVVLADQWNVTLVSTRRDKAIWGISGAETAYGVWATLMFRVRNLQKGSDYIGKGYTPLLVANPWTDRAKAIDYQVFNTVENKATWYYGCCETAFHLLGPGEETVVLIPFDVPEDTQALSFGFSARSGKNAGLPVFLVPNFDQIPARKSK